MESLPLLLAEEQRLPVHVILKWKCVLPHNGEPIIHLYRYMPTTTDIGSGSLTRTMPEYRHIYINLRPHSPRFNLHVAE